MARMALVLQDGTLVDIQNNVNEAKAERTGWPRYVPIKMVDNRPTRYHSKVGETGRLVNDEWVITPQWNNPELEPVRADLLRQIDEKAEEVRAMFITLGSGQALAYQAKNEEASHWKASGKPLEPNTAEYPWASERASRLNTTIANVLSEWEARAAAWSQAGISIESRRESGKAAVASATNVVNAVAAFDAINWRMS